jgi:large conductance mechanosensitive channel
MSEYWQSLLLAEDVPWAWKWEKRMLEEFKKFAMRGNVVDLAVGIIIGVAFGAIVASFVADIIMPIIGAVTGGLDFSNYYLPLASKVQMGLAYEDAKKQGAVLGYGKFITVAMNFLIIAFALFLVVRGINKLRRHEDRSADVPKAPEVPAEVKLLAEIRDLLAANRTKGPPAFASGPRPKG